MTTVIFHIFKATTYYNNLLTVYDSLTRSDAVDWAIRGAILKCRALQDSHSGPSYCRDPIPNNILQTLRSTSTICGHLFIQHSARPHESSFVKF